MRRRTLLVVLAGLAVVVAVILCIPVDRRGISRRNYDRITQGMPLAVVQSMLGEQPPYMFHTEAVYVEKSSWSPGRSPTDERHAWHGSDVSVVVYINGSGQVTEKELMVPSSPRAFPPAVPRATLPRTRPPVDAD
jgi:hypothetical protein